MNYLAIDYGTKKSGLAYNFQSIAMPLKIVPTPLLIDEVILQITERKIEKIVVGIANHVDGRESAHSMKTKKFVQVLKSKIKPNIGVVFHDERFSSFEAAKCLEQTGEKGFDAKRLDDVAASIILESYMNSIY